MKWQGGFSLRRFRQKNDKNLKDEFSFWLDTLLDSEKDVVLLSLYNKIWIGQKK